MTTIKPLRLLCIPYGLPHEDCSYPTKFTDMLSTCENIGELIEPHPSPSSVIYLHNLAEDLAGYDIPDVVDGDLINLYRPPHLQNIILLTWLGEFPCWAYSMGNGTIYVEITPEIDRLIRSFIKSNKQRYSLTHFYRGL